MFDFPPELNVKIEAKQILFDAKVTGEIKKEMEKWELQPPTKILIKPKQRTKNTQIISGGTEELRLQYLITILQKLGLYELKTNWDPIFLSKFDKTITKSTTQDELNQKLGLDKFLSLNSVENPDINSIKENPITVGTCTTAYILNTFGEKEDLEQMNKGFPDPSEPPFLVHLRLPVSVPVCVTHNRDKDNYTFTFTKCGKIEARAFADMLSKVLNNMESDYALKATFVDAEAIDIQEAQKIAEKHDCYCACYQTLETIEDELATSICYVMSREGPSGKPKIEEAIKEIFEIVRLFFCLKCKSAYPISYKTCFEYYHPGHRIPFESGEMEEVDFDEYDEPVVLQNWSCCGECAEDELPCEKRPNGEHERDMNHPEISSYKIENSRFSRKY